MVGQDPNQIAGLQRASGVEYARGGVLFGQALDEQVRLVTGDARIRKSGLVETIW